MKITTKEFHDYLISLGLFRIKINESKYLFFADLSGFSEPKAGDFTKVGLTEEGYPYAQLSKADLFNHSITKGFFDKYQDTPFFRPKSCDHSCSPSDFYKGGKCDRMGCT